MRNDLEEKAAIREVISAYAFFLDDEDYRSLSALFTEDGEWIAAYGTAKGRLEIEELIKRSKPPRSSGALRKHLIANDIITVDGNTATARTTYVAFVNGAGGPSVAVVGSYQDDLEKRAGAWLIKSRRLVHEIKGDLGLNIANTGNE